jgi:hypothetical protein
LAALTPAFVDGADEERAQELVAARELLRFEVSMAAVYYASEGRAATFRQHEARSTSAGR